MNQTKGEKRAASIARARKRTWFGPDDAIIISIPSKNIGQVSDYLKSQKLRHTTDWQALLLTHDDLTSSQTRLWFKDHKMAMLIKLQFG